MISCWSSNLSLSLSLSDLASFTSLRCFVSGSTQVRQTKAPKTHRSVSRRMQSSTYSSTAHYISTALHCSTLYILYTLPQTRELKLGRCKPFWKEVAGSTHAHYGHTHTRTHARTPLTHAHRARATCMCACVRALSRALFVSRCSVTPYLIKVPSFVRGGAPQRESELSYCHWPALAERLA